MIILELTFFAICCRKQLVRVKIGAIALYGLLPHLYHLVHLWTRPVGPELVLRVTTEQMQDAVAPLGKEH